MKAMDLYVPAKSGAGCLLVAKDTGRFMLIQRSDLVPIPLTWSLPGGRMDEDEAPESAARREVLEETGLDLKDLPFRLIYTNDSYAPRFRFYTYACVVDDELVPTLNWESSGHVWCDIDDMPSPLHWGVEQLINHDKAAKRLKTFMEQRKKAG